MQRGRERALKEEQAFLALHQHTLNLNRAWALYRRSTTPDVSQISVQSPVDSYVHKQTQPLDSYLDACKRRVRTRAASNRTGYRTYLRDN